MYQKRQLVCYVSLAATMIFIWGCIKQTYKQCGPSTSIEMINVVINDSLGGNNDGELNPNETVGLLLQLKNIGVVDIPASEGRIFSNQPGISILDSTAAIPEIPVGDTVWAVEEFTIMVDSSAIDECAAFLLTLNTLDSCRIAETALCVPIYYAIYACVDKCRLIEGQVAIEEKNATPDTILIRLSICNRSWSTSLNLNDPIVPVPLPDVAVEIPANTIRTCITGLAIPATPVIETVPVLGSPTIPLNEVFYGIIGANSCGDPVSCLIPGPRTEEFLFTIPHGTLSTSSCIWFSVKIWTGASRSASDCSITLPPIQPKRTVIVYCRIQD